MYRPVIGTAPNLRLGVSLFGNHGQVRAAGSITVSMIILVVFCLLWIHPALSQTETGPTPGAGAGPSQSHNSPSSQYIDQPFLNATASVEQHLDRFQEQLGGFRKLPGAVADSWRLVAESYSPTLLLLIVVLTAGLGILTEYLVRRVCAPFHDGLSARFTGEMISRIWCIGLATLLELVYTGVYLLTSFLLFIVLVPHAPVPYTIASHYVLAGYYIRLLVLVATVMLSPSRSNLRILPYTDEVAAFFARWIIFLCGLAILLVRTRAALRHLSAPADVLLALVGLIIISTALILIVMIFRGRHWVARALSSQHASVLPVLPSQSALARVWHVPALFLVLCISFIWEYRILGSSQVLFGRFAVGLLTIPLFGAFDIWGSKLVSMLIRKSGSLRALAGTEAIAERGTESPQPAKTSLVTYLHYVQTIYRVLLACLLIFLLLGLWDLEIPYGRMFTGGILGVIGIIVVAYLIWQLFTDWVDRKIKAEMPAVDEGELDEGGKGGSRTGTLLILLRKFVLSVLVALALMFILSSFGLDIGPLVAGAGIIGLAISFGAQSLVTDIFAGIFFLIDDAFRVGDYIDIGTAKGTVDHISLRSVRLRHHLGMVQTIPFGKIDTVTNYSRDYIISKLDLRVKYDTDLELVRKLVKRLYRDILGDQEYGPKLTGKLKSQGIRQMDDSAMIIRIKFTTRPGEQFIMRREIYRRIQQAFAANGIAFAHRNVTVYLPENGETPGDREAQALSGAAAAGLVLDDEIRSAGDTGEVVPDNISR